MDLARAFALVNAPAVLAGVSDDPLRALAQTGLGRFSAARALPTLHGGVRTRPVEIFHELAIATRFAYHPTVFETYSFWALLRYLGALDHLPGSSPQTLAMSRAARRTPGNQRAVLSEDLGIGVSAILARHWFMSQWPGFALNLVDVDQAITAGIVDTPVSKRADYLLTAVDRSTQHLLAFGLLESKGTRSAVNHRAQVVRGAQQLEATFVAGRRLPGIVGATLADSDFRYGVVEVTPLRGSGPVDLGPIGRLEGLITPRGATNGGPGGEYLLRAALAKLAELANDPVLFARYAPSRLRVERPQAERRVPTEGRGVRNRGYVGTSTRVPLPGGALDAFLGVDERVVGAMHRGDAQEVVATLGMSQVEASDETLPDLEPDVVTSVLAATTLVLRLL